MIIVGIYKSGCNFKALMLLVELDREFLIKIQNFNFVARDDLIFQSRKPLIHPKYCGSLKINIDRILIKIKHKPIVCPAAALLNPAPATHQLIFELGLLRALHTQIMPMATKHTAAMLEIRRNSFFFFCGVFALAGASTSGASVACFSSSLFSSSSFLLQTGHSPASSGICAPHFVQYILFFLSLFKTRADLFCPS